MNPREVIEQSLENPLPSLIREGSEIRVEGLEIVETQVFDCATNARKTIAYAALRVSPKEFPYYEELIPVSRIFRGNWTNLLQYYAKLHSKRQFLESLKGRLLRVIAFETKGSEHDFAYAHSIDFEFA